MTLPTSVGVRKKLEKSSTKWKEFFHDTLARGFQLYGECVGLYPLPFILVPILITLPCFYVIFTHLSINNDFQFLFSPNGAPSVERELAAENRFNHISPTNLPPGATMNCSTGQIFLPPTTTTAPLRSTRSAVVAAPPPPPPPPAILITQSHFVDMLVERRDGGNMLEPNITDHFFEVYDYFWEHLNFTYHNQTFFTRQLCDGFGPYAPNCFRPYLELKFFASLYYDDTLGSDPNIQFTYPIVKIFNKLVPIFFLVNGVEKNATTQRILSAKVLRMVVVITWNQIPLPVAAEVAAKFKQFALALEKYYVPDPDPIFTFFVSHSAAAELAIPAAAFQAMPLFGVSVALLLMFIFISNIRSPLHTSKPLEAFVGILNPIMAIIVTFGILLLSNPREYPINALLAAMPFLVVAIGVDDMFVLVSGWHDTDPLQPSHKRIGKVMAEAGISVTITSAINVISFATCASQSTKAVAIFGIYASLGLAIEFFFQLTFFMGVMAYAGRREEAQRHCCQCCIGFKSVDPCRLGLMKDKLKKRVAKVERFLEKPEVKNHKIVIFAVLKSVLIAFFFVYLAFALIGCVLITPDFSIKKVLPKESYYYKFIQIQQETVLRETFPLRIYVMNPPDFRDDNQTRLFHSFLTDLESIPYYAVGPRTTELWLNAYEDFRDTAEVSVEDYYRDLKDRWLTIDTFAFWSWELRFGNTLACDKPLQAFHFAVHYQNLTTFNDVINLVHNYRLITDNESYAQFEPYAWNPLSLIVDQVLSLADNTMQDAGVAILLIGFLSMMLMPHLVSMFWVSYFLLTVEAGVVGYLKIFLQADLDFFSMITVAMSVGFSVDYMLHISYCYYRSKESGVNVTERTLDTISTMAFPVMQASVATFLGVFGLVFVTADMFQVIFYTLIIVIVAGILHGLVFLPTVYSLLD